VEKASGKVASGKVASGKVSGDFHTTAASGEFDWPADMMDLMKQIGS